MLGSTGGYLNHFALTDQLWQPVSHCRFHAIVGTTGKVLKVKELETFEELPSFVWELRLVVVQDANAAHVSFANV